MQTVVGSFFTKKQCSPLIDVHVNQTQVDDGSRVNGTAIQIINHYSAKARVISLNS